jgi:glutamate racemase
MPYTGAPSLSVQSPCHCTKQSVFAGIGSYAIVERVRAAYPDQDILYPADRASFPDGAKSPEQLLACVRAATNYLARQGCVAVALPVIGVFPPIRAALLRVRSMIGSAAMRDYVRAEGGGGEVALVNASALVELVENFDFINRPGRRRDWVAAFIEDVLAAHPAVDVMTMSSTHLPWLKPFFQASAPGVAFLDPADTVLDELRPHVSAGGGRTRCVATASAALGLADFNAALLALGTSLQAGLVAV